ncbi:DNA adenine methylase [Bartonella sp. CB178]|uniref:DNA adenine methylase n=1 Tax=Bartonella sp. CB178 TaxID=3112255 RepID=UPI00300E39DA
MIIDNYIKKQKTLCSPFVGGGSVGLTLAKKGTKIYAYDNFEPLVIFWQMLPKDALALAEKVSEYESLYMTLKLILTAGFSAFFSSIFLLKKSSQSELFVEHSAFLKKIAEKH